MSINGTDYNHNNVEKIVIITMSALLICGSFLVVLFFIVSKLKRKERLNSDVELLL